MIMNLFGKRWSVPHCVITLPPSHHFSLRLPPGTDFSDTVRRAGRAQVFGTSVPVITTGDGDASLVSRGLTLSSLGSTLSPDVALHQLLVISPGFSTSVSQWPSTLGTCIRKCPSTARCFSPERFNTFQPTPALHPPRPSVWSRQLPASRPEQGIT